MQLICLQLDLARQKENIEYVKSYMKFAKENGYNAVLLYLENAVRTSKTEYFDKNRTYSKEEMLDLVDYSKTIDIELIPAFENLGHLEKFLEYPALTHLAETQDVSKCGRFFDGAGGKADCGCTSNPELYAFLDEYISEVCALFPSKYVHMGLDEPFEFAVCEKCMSKIKAGETRADLFLEHILHTYRLAKSLGKRMMMWDDFFEYADIVEKLPRDIIMCNWNYEHVGEEPSGHWVNRNKNDWFYYYDRLGFDYMFCTYAHGASANYAIDSFTDYASNHKPFGALMTQWEKSNSFYLGTYPVIAYAGRLWSGQTEKEKVIDVYTDILGGSERAGLLLSFQFPLYHSNDSLKFGQTAYAGLKLFEPSIRYGLSKMRECLDEKADTLANDIFIDAYNYLLQRYLEMKKDLLVSDIYGNLSTGNKDFEKTFDEIEEEYAKLYIREKVLWAKYRNGIVSDGSAFENKHLRNRQKIEELKAFEKANKGASVLSVDLGIMEAFGTPRVEISVKYAGEELKRIYQGAIKPNFVALDFGGCYTIQFVIENKSIEYVLFNAYGEGATYPMHFRYVQNGLKYTAEGVEVISGKVQNAENVLYNDSRFATMGYDDGVRHFYEHTLSRVKNQILVQFKPLLPVGIKM